MQLLGLCPLLATSNNLVNGLTMGLATTLVLCVSALLVSQFRKQIPKRLRLACFMLIIAGAVTAVELLMRAFFYDIYLRLGLFIPLIVTNCAIIGRAESFASRNGKQAAFYDALFMGLGFTWVISLLGALREWLTQGSLLRGLDLLLGKNFTQTFIQLPSPNILLAALPAGAFILFALIIALKQYIDLKVKK